jgi:hypothetical protein
MMEAIVKDDGTLIADIPKALWGKKVYITVSESAPTGQKTQALSQWDAVSTALREARAISPALREAGDILDELREFRESS